MRIGLKVQFNSRSTELSLQLRIMQRRLQARTRVTFPCINQDGRDFFAYDRMDRQLFDPPLARCCESYLARR